MSATNVPCAGKRGNICVGNKVSATMCPRFPGPLGDYGIRVLRSAHTRGLVAGTCRTDLLRGPVP